MVRIIYSRESYSGEKFNFKQDEKLELLNVSSFLRNMLFNGNSGYKDSDDPITRAGMRFEISRLEKFDEIAGELKLLSSLFMFWYDVRLTWEPNRFSVFQEKAGYPLKIDYLQMKMKDIWKPDIKLLNPLKEMDIFKEKENEKVTLGFPGLLFYDGLLKTDTYCKPNLKDFPFDEHECSVQFVATSTVIANLNNKPQVFNDNAKWIYFQMTSCDLDLSPSRYGAELNNERRVLVFPIRLIRRPSYLFVNIAVPLFVLSLLNIVVYFIPAVPDERLSFCIALLLSFTVYLIYVAGLIPETSNPVPLVIYFLVFQFLFIAFITCSSFLTALLNQRQEEKPIPNAFLRIVNVIHKTRARKVERQLGDTNPPNENMMIKTGDQQIVNDEELKSTGVNPSKITWKCIALLLDKICLTVTVIILVIEVVLFSFLASKLSAEVHPDFESEICQGSPMNLTKICFDDVSDFCVDATDIA
ncbi:neuronal acetylcholine receptor subunit alpha-6-like [Saccostrea echinata]|uniref:neuronal acetylcholine receptor subunit alpha-6-like n=1 Tax=Saccostrea echinata TaxID=191078 RepID=UPI002A81D435|nr:neuronal acetylcholine receptor subunit alpha-6-like [Saccostrea echinata]